MPEEAAQQTTKLDHAIAHAKAGFPVFPLIPNGKRPLIENWRNLATTDESRIRQWWESDPNANVGIATDSLLVIDIDPRKGGDDAFAELAMVEDFPKTRRSDTWSGGAHVLYALPPHVNVRGGANVLGRGLDIRAWGGLIAAPGSSIDGKPYKWGNDRPIAPAPQWLIDRCKSPRAKTATAGQRVVSEDDVAVQRAEAWLLDHAPEAQTGVIDDTAFRVAARLYDEGISLETCRELLADWSFNKCHPPMDPSDIERVASSAARNRTKAIGANHPEAPGFDAVEVDENEKPTQALVDAMKLSQTVKSRLHYLPFKASVAHALEHAIEPLIDGLIDCGAMSVVYGESGCGKSFTELDKDFHIAAGLPWGGMKTKQGAVVYVAAEGGAGIHKRMKAMADHYKREDVPLFVIPCPVDLLHAEADMKPLIEMVRHIEQVSGQKVLKVTLDTLSRVMAGGDENGSTDMGVLVKHFDHIRASLDTHLAVVHHTGKDKARGARGHSLLRAATDTEIEIDAGRIKVTKQKDMDGSVDLRFVVKPVRVGTNRNGRDVTSCYVELRKKSEVPNRQLEMSGHVGSFKSLLEKAVKENYDTSEKGVYDQVFTTAFAIIAAADACAAGTMSVSASEDALKKRVERYLNEATESGHLKNPVKGQWVIIPTDTTDIEPT